MRAAVVAVIVAALLAGCADKPESLLTSAKEHLAKKERDAAIIQLRGALQKNPDMAEARFLLGQSLIETSDLLGAEKELRRAADLKYPPDMVVPALARVLVARGEYKKALEEFGNAAMTTPEAKADLQTSLGRARMSTGNVQDAGSDFAAALAAQPGYPPALVSEARLKAAAGDLPGAARLLEAALAKDPASAEAWQLKGDIAGARQERDDAIASFRKAVATKPTDLLAHYKLITLLIQDNKIEDANKQLAAMKKVAPKHPMTLLMQAFLAYYEKNYVAARDAVQLHLKGVPNSLQGLLLSAQIDYRLGAYPQAESVLVTILKQTPQQLLARTLLVQTYLRQGKPAQALEVMKPILLDEKLDSDALALAGEVYMQNGDVVKASGYFEKAAALDPKNVGKRTALALSHVVKGEGERGLEELASIAAEDPGIKADLALVAANLRKRNYDAALAAIATIEKKQPDKPLPYNLRGAALHAKGDIPGARRSFERALEVDPKFLPAAVNLARLDMSEKKPDAARKRFEALLEKDPKNSKALLALAALRAQAGGSPDEVAALIQKAVAANPTDVEARLALISVWAKEPKKAIAAAQEALTALPNRPEIMDALGLAYRAAGDTNQAIATYNKLAQLQPDSTLPHMRLAQIHVAANDSTAAAASARKALAIKPDLVEAQQILVALGISGGRYNEALAAARDLQKRRPKESIGYVLEGYVHSSRKAWNEAIAVYRTGLKGTGNPDLATYLHGALVSAQKTTEADSFAASWMKDHPRDLIFLKYAAERAMQRKNYADAARLYKTVLETMPDDVLVLNNLAWVSGQMKDPKALEYAEKADKLAPNNPNILDTYGMLLLEKGDSVRGVEMLQRAVALAPRAAPIRLNLASALARSGQKEAAKKELDAVAKLGGKYAGQAETAKTMLGL
jgi:putative PEP-CTERM system TPR-repeat lipoprotein